MAVDYEKVRSTATAGSGKNILEVGGLTMHFPLTQGIIFQRQVGAVRAVDGVDFFVEKGETLGLVGESGCGKSTTGRAILQLYKPTAGEVRFDGTELTKLGGEQMRKMRRRMQMIFQDPYAPLNPRVTVANNDRASASRARWRSSQSSSSATSRSRRSTSPSRRRSSTFSRSCRTASSSRTFSSRTTSRWSGTSATASR